MKEHMTIDVEFEGFPLKVGGIYYPGSPTIMYYNDMSGHPGDPPEFDISEVNIIDSEWNIYDLFSDNDLNQIEYLVLEKIDD